MSCLIILHFVSKDLLGFSTTSRSISIVMLPNLIPKWNWSQLMFFVKYWQAWKKLQKSCFISREEQSSFPCCYSSPKHQHPGAITFSWLGLCKTIQMLAMYDVTKWWQKRAILTKSKFLITTKVCNGCAHTWVSRMVANGKAPLQWTFETCGGDALHP